MMDTKRHFRIIVISIGLLCFFILLTGNLSRWNDTQFINIYPRSFCKPGPEPCINLMVESVPNDADIVINGSWAGITNQIIQLEEGSYTVAIIHSGYQKHTENCTVNRSTTYKVLAVLVPEAHFQNSTVQTEISRTMTVTVHESHDQNSIAPTLSTSSTIKQQSVLTDHVETQAVLPTGIIILSTIFAVLITIFQYKIRHNEGDIRSERCGKK